MTAEDVERLMKFDGIVRNRLKIAGAINNAKCFLAVQKEFGSFYQYVVSFLPGGRPIVNRFTVLSEIPASSPESDALSKDMKNGDLSFSVQPSVMLFCRQPVLSTTTWKAVSAKNKNRLRQIQQPIPASLPKELKLYFLQTKD